MSSQFGVLNGVKQGEVLSPLLFAVYIDGLLIRIEETGVGCHMGIRFIGALAFADHLNLLAPTLSGLKILIDVCEKYAKEFNIKFNGSKSCLLLFKGRNCKISTRGVTVNGVSLTVSETSVHLGHHMSTKDKECIINAAKNSFWRSFNLFISDYGHIYSFLKMSFLDNIAVYTIGHLCGNCKVMELSFCVAWRKALKIIWSVHPQTHCDVIAALLGQTPLILSLRARFVNFCNKCLENDNNVVKYVAFICKSIPMSCAGNNYRMLLNDKNELTTEGLSVWNERCCKLNDSINVIKEIIDVRDEFKECQGFGREEVEGFIEMLCIDGLFLTYPFLTKQSKFLSVYIFLPLTNTSMYF